MRQQRTLARGTTMMARPSPCAIKPASGQAPTLLRDVTPDPDVRWDQVAVKEDGRTSCVALWQLHSVETGSWLEASSRILSARLCQHRCLRRRRHNRNEDASVRRNVVLGPKENLRAINWPIIKLSNMKYYPLPLSFVFWLRLRLRLYSCTSKETSSWMWLYKTAACPTDSLIRNWKRYHTEQCLEFIL